MARSVKRPLSSVISTRGPTVVSPLIMIVAPGMSSQRSSITVPAIAPNAGEDGFRRVAAGGGHRTAVGSLPAAVAVLWSGGGRGAGAHAVTIASAAARESVTARSVPRRRGAG